MYPNRLLPARMNGNLYKKNPEVVRGEMNTHHRRIRF